MREIGIIQSLVRECSGTKASREKGRAAARSPVIEPISKTGLGVAAAN